MCKSNIKYFILSFFIFISFNAFSSIDILNSPIAENRIKLHKKFFKIKIKKESDITIKAFFDNSSFEWIRVNSNLLVPRARMRIKIRGLAKKIHLEYKGITTNFQQVGNYAYTEIYTSLFESDKVFIKDKENLLANIVFEFNTQKIKKKVLIDYTCSRNQIRIEGLDDEFVSVGCKTNRIGKFGKERPMLEVTWLSPQLEVLNSKPGTYNAVFVNKRPVVIDVRNKKTKKIKTITIKANIPKRLHRLFTAYGFGPYTFETKRILSSETQTISDPVAPALMFYLNYKISQTTSIRGFEAAVFKKSTFNNAGVYLGSDFGFSLDNKLYFTTLLGAQHLYFKFDDSTPVTSEIIFPQGLEFMYRHAFDIPNYIISGGAFLSPSESIDYQNIWIRWGKNYFWELNYIFWGKEGFSAKTWGVSVGFPFKGFL